MKTNTFNYFRNAFAIVGFFIIACSVGTADEPTVEPEPPVQSNNGKYQVEWDGSRTLMSLNTATGVTKFYTWDNSGSGVWIPSTLSDITFTH